MEHSTLHALQLLGTVAALGGPFLVLALLHPAGRALGLDVSSRSLSQAIQARAAHWVFIGALVASAAAMVDVLVEVAEVQGKTVFGGVDLRLAVRLLKETTVGRLLLARAGFLLLAAVAARWPGLRYRWWLVGAASLGAVACAGFVSHAAAQPDHRWPALAGQMAHIAAAGAWIGVVFQLFGARQTIESAKGPSQLALLGEMIRRFSPIALTGSALLGLSGLYGVYRFLATPAAVPTSAYGLTLIVKLLMLGPLLYAGCINYRVIAPGLRALKQKGAEVALPLLLRFGRTLELEATAGVLLITVAGILASIPPPGEEGALRLTQAQTRALLSPDLPTTAIVNPATFYGATTRTLDDMRYSEFMHNWSGVMVCLLGLGWLGQSARGRLGVIAGRVWPALILPFGVFIALGADPEVWLLRRVSLGQALADPQLLEHQLGAAMALVLAWLGWRDLRNPPEGRPLGYKLPLLMILGSLLLLGHAHSTLTVTEDLTNLINVQHAIFGAFALFAGTIRWLELRKLIPQPTARWVWPGLVVGLGLFMAFFYREVV